MSPAVNGETNALDDRISARHGRRRKISRSRRTLRRVASRTASAAKRKSPIATARKASTPPRRKRQSRRPPSPLAAAYGHLSLRFEANQGQTDSSVKFLARGSSSELFLANTEAVLVLTKSGRVGYRNDRESPPDFVESPRQSEAPGKISIHGPAIFASRRKHRRANFRRRSPAWHLELFHR